MEGKNIYSRLVQGGSLQYHLHCSADSCLRSFRFYKAFVTQGRADGTCRLYVLWQKGKQRKTLLIQNYLLCFNHHGLKEYQVEEVRDLSLQGWLNRLDCKVVNISLAEAASLIQDAAEQNKRFHTRIPQGLSSNHPLLEFDTLGVDHSKLSYRLLPRPMDVRMFTNLYLSAWRRLDRSLLYDLAHPEKQQALGSRSEYLRDGEDGLSSWTFLRTGLNEIKTQGRRNMVTAYAVVCTPQDELLRISYQLEILEEKGRYSLLEFKELERENLSALHPDNPLNYQVYATLYRHSCKEEIESWLAQQSGVFLAGELTSGEVYKWLNGGPDPWEEYVFSQSISAELYLTSKELLVFSQKPEKLAGIIRLLAEDLPGKVMIQGQYHLNISQLYAKLLAAQEWGGCKELGPRLQDYKASSMILLLEPREIERFKTHIGRVAAAVLNIGQGAAYYFIEKERLKAELYSVGRWLKLSIYGGTGEEELAVFKDSFNIVDVIRDSELGNHYDLFTPPLSEERKWVIFRQLRLLSQEAGLIKKMGIVPSVREAAEKLGVVI